MKTKFKSTLQKMKKLQDKTIAHADLIKGGTMENCHPQYPPPDDPNSIITM
jgi:glycerol-3-phosphate responsive antiterminator